MSEGREIKRRKKLGYENTAVWRIYSNPWRKLTQTEAGHGANHSGEFAKQRNGSHLFQLPWKLPLFAGFLDMTCLFPLETPSEKVFHFEGEPKDVIWGQM